MNFDKVNLPIGVSNHTKLDLSCEHITTMNFGRMQPVYYRHMIKGEKLNSSVFSTVRVAPMAVPVYGKIRLSLRAFFVPYRLCMPQFDAFYNDTIGVNYGNSSLVASVPTINNDTIVNCLISPSYSSAGSSTNYDFKDEGSNYYVLNNRGRAGVKLLHALGYRFNFSTKDTTTMSALALLAFGKLYVDWYCNQNYLDSADVLYLKSLLSYNDPTSNKNLSVVDLACIFNIAYCVVYPSNYFTSAYDNPVSPNTVSTELGWNDPTLNAGAYIDTDSNRYVRATPTMIAASLTSGGVTTTQVGTQYIHDALHRLTDYSRRHQLSGSLEIDRYLAEFGAGTEATKIMRSIYVGSDISDIRVGDVTSTANTSAGVSNLGDYSGKGFGQTQKTWDFKTDEFGIFIVCASIMPSAGMYQGVDRHNLDLQKTDIFVPTLDGLSTQSIAKREVYLSNDGAFGTAAQYNGSFGFTGRYGHYKRPINWVTGDLDLPNFFPGGSAWHLQRMFSDTSFGGSANNISHSLAFTRSEDASQYDRIFQSTNHEFDKFYVDFAFNVSSLAPCKPLFDTYDFAEDNQRIKLAVNGSKMD